MPDNTSTSLNSRVAAYPDRTVFFWDHFRLDGDPLAALNQSVDNHNSLPTNHWCSRTGMCHFDDQLSARLPQNRLIGYFYFHLASTGQCAH
jgi:hypothetical protein